jgi:hypothetical protein
MPAAAANPAKGQAAPPPLGHLPHGLPAVLSLDGAANPAISISKITRYSPFTGYLACNFGIWDSFFRIYLHFYQKGQCLVKMKVFFYKNVSQFRKSLETVPLPNTDTIVRAAGSRVAPEPPTPHPHYSGWQISWQIIGILPKRKWILAQVCLEAQHCEGFAEIRSGSRGGVKGLKPRFFKFFSILMAHFL